MTPDIQYGYRVHGPFAPKAGHRFQSQAIVLDPYAPAVSGGHRWGSRAARPRRPLTRGRLVLDEFDWEDDVPPATPLAQTVIYELHVRGYTATRLPASPTRARSSAWREDSAT